MSTQSVSIKRSVRGKLFGVGLTLEVACFCVCVVSYYLVYFAWPVYAIAVLMIFLSERSAGSKLIAVLVPVILWWPSVLGFICLYGWARSTPETYVIPANINGAFRVVYAEPCGTSLAEENGRLTYVIPSNGILVCSNAASSGWDDSEYYLLDSSGNKLRVDGGVIGQAPKTYPVIVSTGSGTMSLDTSFLDEKSLRQNDIHFSDFLVVRDSSNLFDLWVDADPELSKATVAVVRSCRGSAQPDR